MGRTVLERSDGTDIQRWPFQKSMSLLATFVVLPALASAPQTTGSPEERALFGALSAPDVRRGKTVEFENFNIVSKSKPWLRIVVPPGTTLEKGVRLCLPTATAVLYLGLNDRAQIAAVNDPRSEINRVDQSLSRVSLGRWKGRGALYRQKGWSYVEYWFFTKRQHLFLRLSFENDSPQSLREAGELLRFILATAAQRQTRP